MKKKTRKKIAYTLYSIILIPLILFGLTILFLGYFMLQNSMYRQTSNELQNVALTMARCLENDYPGDFRTVEGENTPGALYVYKGDTDITLRYDLVDEIHNATGLDITIFYKDTRVLTTLRDAYDARHTGTGASTPITRDVLEGGTAQYYPNALIEGTNYCCYYMPLRNSDGTVAGMLAVGKPTVEVTQDVWLTFRPMIAVDLILMLVILLLITRFTGRIGKDVAKIHEFLQEASRDNPDAVLDPSVERRGDEMGEIGTAIVEMHRALRDSMEMDPLTRISNRRSADRKMKKLMVNSRASGSPLSLSIGDIDFFKRVNDTYGHDVGDLVLKAVADVLNEHMKSCGFVARWGGEEFLLVFYNRDLETAREALEKCLEDIRALEIKADDVIVKVTMSFGVTLWDGAQTFDDLVKKADELLYYAKEHGRNRITHVLPGEAVPTPPAPVAGGGSSEILELDPEEADAILNAKSGEAAVYDLDDVIDVDDSDEPDTEPDPDDPYSDEEAEEDEYP